MKEKDIIAIRKLRKSIIEIGYNCGQSAHFGGGLSMLEALYVLYSDFLRVTPETKDEPQRDIFVLSKGHGVLGLYAVLHYFGFISDEIYNTFQQNGSPLIAHPIKNLSLGIESSNGSLGQGLSFISGIALASKIKGEERRFVTILGDGECNEGSVWESIMFCNQYKLNNIVAVVDNNGFQNDNSVREVSIQETVEKRWKAFGWKTFEIDGHSCEELRQAYSSAFNWDKGPCVIIANTNKGNGISFMQNNNDWHHNRLTSKTYEEAIKELIQND